MVAAPPETPVTVPALFTDAIEALPVLQVPPGVVVTTVVVAPGASGDVP